MKTQVSVPLFALLVAIILVNYPATARQVPTSTEDIEFVRSNCQKIDLYRDVCFNTLSRHAKYIHRDPANLAIVAMILSRRAAEKMASHVTNIDRLADVGGGADDDDGQVASAVEQCRSSFDDAKDSIHDSIKQMWDLGNAGSFAGSSRELRYKLSDVQTWMSGALTCEEDCLDAFEELSDGKIKRLVQEKTQALEQVTSVALALVNSYAKLVIKTP